MTSRLELRVDTGGAVGGHKPLDWRCRYDQGRGSCEVYC